MAPERERITKAFSAMRSLGISDETVRPALRKLLKLYNKNWELIEEDNYRTLADAIFEYEEDKLKVEKKPNTINEDNEPPSKKPHGGDPDDEVSSTGGNGKNILDPDGDGRAIPRGSSGIKRVESSQSVSVDRTSKPRHCAGEAPNGSKCMDLVPVNSCPDEENSYTPRASGAIGPMRKRIDGSPQFAIPTLQIHPGSNVTSQHSDTRKKKIGSSSAINPQTMSQTTYDIASSACGQVKISLTCKHTALQQNFHFSSADEILSFARQFCNTGGSHFSLIDLLNEFCEGYLEMGSDSYKRSRVNTSPGNYARRSLRPTVDSIKKEHLEGDLRKRASSSKKRVIRKISDITNGTEKVKISLIDETGNEDLPRYVYSPENITYESAYVHVSLARISDDDCCLDCSGDCLSSSIPCPCACDTGGEFAYTLEGLLSEKFISSCISIKHSEEKQPLFYCQDCPLERAKNVDTSENNCKGHRFRKFIKECWRKCGCNMECGNRVVQRGIARKLQVFLTSGGKGWGLRTLEELPKGAFICEYVGEILTNMELYERNTKSTGEDKHVYPVLLDADWATEGVLKDEEALCLDATHFGNVARFINHRCFDGNLIEVPVQVETPDRHYYHLAFFTKRRVDALEELTWDYEIDFQDNSHPVKAFKCLCGSEHCRDRRREEKNRSSLHFQLS